MLKEEGKRKHAVGEYRISSKEFRRKKGRETIRSGNIEYLARNVEGRNGVKKVLSVEPVFLGLLIGPLW